MIETIFICFIIIGLLWHAMQRPRNFPPGPVCLPYFGNLHSFDHWNPQNGWEYLRERYGDLTGMIVPKFRLVVASGWTAIKEILSNEDFQGRPDVCLLRDRFNGGRFGLLFKDGEDWKEQRRFALHHFRNLGFGRKSHESVVLEEAVSLADEIEGLRGAPVVLENLFGISAINITWHVIGGQRFDRKDPSLLKLVEDVKESVHSVKIVGSPAVLFPFIRYIFPEKTGYKGIKNGCRGILDFIRASIRARQHNLESDELEPNNFIDIYLQQMKEQSQKNGSSFSMGQLEGICMDLLAAGSDTSSAVLSFAVMFLCLHPHLQDKVHEEILNAVGTDRLPSYEDKAKLVYTEAFLCEVMRIRHPVPTFPPHVATKDSKLAGFSIPKGTILILNVKSIFTDPGYWKNPDDFRPERFISDDGIVRKDERIIYFGKGKRSCLGETLAKMSSFLTFVCLVQRFSFEFSQEGPPPSTEGIPGFTIAPPEFRVVATPRRLQNQTSNAVI